MSNDGDQSGLPPFGDRVSALWQRLKEHRIAQWSIGYVAVAYGIQHAVSPTGYRDKLRRFHLEAPAETLRS
jgi:hypothetical protein